MPTVEYSNTNVHYYTNAVNKMYYFKNDAKKEFNLQETGWHFIPNKNYSNWLTPRQWFDLITNHDKFRLMSMECTVQNEIPLTDNLAIGQDTTFMTYNNTIYGLGYTDKHYETAPVESIFDLTMREGVVVDAKTGNITGKMTLPLYNHPLVKQSTTDCFAVFAWDPFIHANSLMELRPGKNAIGFKWEAHPSDHDKWYTTSCYCALQNNNDDTNIPTRNTTSTDYRDSWMAPGQLMKGDPRTSDFINKKTNIYKYIWNYPITNWFMKMMPIVDTKNNLLKHQGQVVINRKIRFEVTPRTNTTNFPQIQSYWTPIAKYTKKEGEDIKKPTYDLAYRPYENIGQVPPADWMDAEIYITTTTPTQTVTSKPVTTMAKIR
uniref:Capsid protein n=1 Tax=Parvoviridae sp. TaxID=1940570 RepID=A0A7D3QKF3_9VIRU|nr:MAG: capsid protein [Parvoviridae sp.]